VYYNTSWPIRGGAFALAIGSVGTAVDFGFRMISAGFQFQIALSANWPIFLGPNTTMIGAIVGAGFGSIFAIGSLMLFLFRTPRKLSIKKVGWALAVIGGLAIVASDLLLAAVLKEVISLRETSTVFLSSTIFFNRLSVVGTTALALGLAGILITDLGSNLLPRPISIIGIAAATVCFVGSCLYFVGLRLPEVIGVSIAIVLIVLFLLGIRTFRLARSGA
jgi:hypothetical protein